MLRRAAAAAARWAGCMQTPTAVLGAPTRPAPSSPAATAAAFLHPVHTRAPPPPPPPPPTPPLLSRVFDLLDPPAVARLARDGYLILDDALPDPPALAAAITAAAPFMTPNASIFVDSAGTPTRLDKAGVAEAEPGSTAASDPALDAACPSLVGLREEAASLASLIAALAPPDGGGDLTALGGPGAVKAQIACGEKDGAGAGAGSSSSSSSLRGGFALHADADEALDARRLTLTLYPAGLPPGAGGELVLYPSLDPATPPVVIPPAPGRAVLFSACRLPHAVAPSAVRRLCASVWLGVRGRGLPPPPPPTPVAAVLRGLAGAPPQAVRRAVLSEPDARRALARVRLGRVWEDSMVRAHGASAALEAVLERGAVERAALGRAFEAVGLDWRAGGLGEAADDPAPAWF